MTASDTKTQTPKQPTCAMRWKANKNGRIRDLRKLFSAYQEGNEEKYADELGTFSEYGLCFDYVAPGTFNNQVRGYWRYQISWGGPSDEFRFYAEGCGDREPWRISYVFLDWFDGHERGLVGRDLELMRQIWGHFSEVGLTKTEYRKGTDQSEE